VFVFSSRATIIELSHSWVTSQIARIQFQQRFWVSCFLPACPEQLNFLFSEFCEHFPWVQGGQNLKVTTHCLVPRVGTHEAYIHISYVFILSIH
jgi:hypothetical protein